MVPTETMVAARNICSACSSAKPYVSVRSGSPVAAAGGDHWVPRSLWHDRRAAYHVPARCYRLHYLRIGRQRYMRMNRQPSLVIVGVGRRSRRRDTDPSRAGSGEPEAW